MHAWRKFISQRQRVLPRKHHQHEAHTPTPRQFQRRRVDPSLQNTRTGSSLSFVVVAHSERHKQDSGSGAVWTKDLPTVSNDPPRDIFLYHCGLCGVGYTRDSVYHSCRPLTSHPCTVVTERYSGFSPAQARFSNMNGCLQAPFLRFTVLLKRRTDSLDTPGTQLFVALSAGPTTLSDFHLHTHA